MHLLYYRARYETQVASAAHQPSRRGGGGCRRWRPLSGVPLGAFEVGILLVTTILVGLPRRKLFESASVRETT